MNFEIDQTVFNQIFPFSFQTDRSGGVLFIGRSLTKLFPDLKTGEHFSAQFRIVRPRLKLSLTSSNPLPTMNPLLLSGELVLLARALRGTQSEPAQEIILRGQIISVTPASDLFLFLMSPSITEMKQITAWNLDFSDFPPADPIFDSLMLLQSERTARQKSEANRAQLEWQNRISQLLHRITLESEEMTEVRPAIALTLKLVCQELDWQIGHAFIRKKGQPDVLISSGIWYLAHNGRYSRFQEITSRICMKKGEGVAGEAFQTGEILWIAQPAKIHRFLRKKALEEFKDMCCVQVPVLIHGEVVAILEFYSEKQQKAEQNLTRFFDVLRHRLSTVIERQNAKAREKEQLVGMASSSKLAALGEMAAGVGHEINNPLTAAILGIQWLQEKFKDGKFKKHEVDPDQVSKILRQMKSACDRIAKIVAGLKVIGREGSGDPFVVIPLKEIVEDSLILCEARFKQGGVKLKILPFSGHLKLNCRPVQISQVILNLLNNSFDAVAGKPKAWVTFEARELPDQVEFSVTDSGMGIAPQVAEKIMRPFFTTKAAGKGTGLGLSVSSRIISDHGGTLSLDRESPNTRFVVRLPKAG